jgi:glycerol-3-phosphate dehydrogenase
MEGGATRWPASVDLAVVGGGITGSCLASLAARNGWSVLLIDRDDLGGGVSANSLKVIHGGLRYLQHLDIRRMRESITARSLLLRIAPELVVPRAFAMPLTRFGARSRPALALALALNERISADRNRDLRPDRKLPSARLVGRSDMERLFPGVVLPTGHCGGAVWYDAVAEDTERLTLAFALDARHHGAVVASHTDVTRLLITDEGCRGLAVADRLTGEQGTVTARHVAWAAGAPSAGAEVWPEITAVAPVRWVRAVNLVIDRPWPGPTGLAVPVRRRDGGWRNLFFVPWRSGVMVGTWYDPVPSGCAQPSVTEAEIDGWLEDVRGAFGGGILSRADVATIHAGLLPATRSRPDEPSREVIVHGPGERAWPSGFTLVQSVKYTTAPMVAKRALVRIAAALDAPEPAAWWHEPLRDALRAAEPWTPASIRHAIEAEAARTLEDIIFRRIGSGAFRCPSRPELEAIAAIAAPLFGWDAARAGHAVDACLRQRAITR